MTPPPTPRPVRGFTLMEVLVVLVIAALLMTMLFQSLQIFRRAQERINAQSVAAWQQRLAGRWYDTSVSGLFPASDRRFVGDERHWQGYSLQPVEGIPGAPVWIEWSLADAASGSVLRYRSPPRAELAFARPGRWRFVYVDADGTRYRQWPPSKGLHAQLPAAIGLWPDGDERSAPAVMAAVAGPRDAYVEPFELEQE